MGGSFNPPTMAHLRLMKAAVDGIGADRGLFVPSSDAYVFRKMRRAVDGKIQFPEEVRLRMLQAMCEGDVRLGVETVEFGTTRPQTLETLKKVAAANPESEVFFLIGADKLDDMKRWSTRKELLVLFGVVAFERNGENAREKVEQDEIYRRHTEAFRFLPMPEGVDGISSTEVRVRYCKGGVYAELVHPGIGEILSQNGLETFSLDKIRQKVVQMRMTANDNGMMEFRGSYDFLSNFYPAEIELDGIVYSTGETAFQAQKTLDMEARKAFAGLPPGKAKRVGRRLALRSDWESVKLGLMEQIVRAKFAQHPELAERLVATGTLPLVEGNAWHDLYWGVDVNTGEGENHLGKILMKVRDELVKSEEMKIDET